MVTKEIQVALKNGLEARPVAVFVQKASQYKSDIYVCYDNKKVNGKSIMGMMSLCLAPGEMLTISAEGPDEQTAADDIEAYLISKE